MGTILAYTGPVSNIPAGWFLCDGSNNTPDLRDKFLEGFGTYPTGTSVSPGLPNLKGTFIAGYMNDNLFKSPSRTPFSVSGGADTWWYVNFDASGYNSIYGNSNTVQPNAYIVYYIIKIK